MTTEFSIDIISILNIGCNRLCCLK